jgi:hypothetical protein
VKLEAWELSAERRAQMLDNGSQQGLPLLAAGYREVLDLSRKYSPCVTNLTQEDPYGEYHEARSDLPPSDR